MSNLFILLSFFIILKSNAQNDTLLKSNNPKQSHEEPYTQKLPVFINGGDEGFTNFIKDNIIIPSGPKKVEQFIFSLLLKPMDPYLLLKF